MLRERTVAGEYKVRRGHYTTDAVPLAKRHDNWSERGWPSVAALFKSTPIGDFSTSAEDVTLDDIAISFASGTARLLERSPERIAADGIDILAAGLLLEGEMEGTAGAREFQLGAGEILLFDMAQPITMTMSVSRSVQIAVPRAVAEARIGSVAPLHGLVVPRDQAATVGEKLSAVRTLRDDIRNADASHFAGAIIDSLAKAVQSLR
jgi:hypothetical protein